MAKPSPFIKSNARPKRIRMMVYGDSGTGKTTFALRLGKCAVMDLERSSVAYSDVGEFDFEVSPIEDIGKALSDINWLLTEKHNYVTLVIDPITVLYEMLIREWTKRFLKFRRSGVVGHKHEFYDIQPNDWRLIKQDLKSFIATLHRLDMNLVCIAREKTLYSDSSDEMMKKVGKTFDGDRSLVYEFDTVLHLTKDDTGYYCQVEKDRSLAGRFPPKFKVDNDFTKPPTEIIKAIGTDLFREPEPIKLATIEQVSSINAMLAVLKISEEDTQKSLAKYNVTQVKDLSEEDARQVMAKLNERMDKETPI
jgi:hypothetical protein